MLRLAKTHGQMMRALSGCSLIVVTLACCGHAQDASPQPVGGPIPSEQLRAALDQLRPVLNRSEELIMQGKRTEANEALLQTFPDSSRTPAQAVVLANVLYQQAPDVSRQLHQAVAKAYPEDPGYLLEWALQLHRAKDFKGALNAYKSLLKIRPDNAPVLGLAAGCAIFLDDSKQAVELWQMSEAAKSGTLEEFEGLLCAVNGPLPRDDKREDLMKRCLAGERDAAIALVRLDLDWDLDWWNGGPHQKRLRHDLAALRPLIRKGDIDLAAAELAAELGSGLLSEGQAKTRLLRGGLMKNPPEIPADGGILAFLLSSIERHQLADKVKLRTLLGPALRFRCNESGDAELHNALAWLHIGTDDMEDIVRKAWNKTHDPRFAASLLRELAKKRKLVLDSLELAEAERIVPLDANVAAAKLGLSQNSPSGKEAALIQFIKAGYNKLPSGGLLLRPSARGLQNAFVELGEALARKSGK